MTKAGIIEKVEGSFYKRGSTNSNFSEVDNYNFFRHLINHEITPATLKLDEPGTQLAFDCFNLSDDAIHMDVPRIILEARQKFYDLEKEKPGSSVIHLGMVSKRSDNGVQQ